MAGIKRALGVEEVLSLPPSLVEERRAELAARRPGERSLNRLLEFAPLVAREPPADLDIPAAFVAAGFAFGDAYPETEANVRLAVATIKTLAEDDPVVVIDPSPALRDGLAHLAEDGRVHLLDSLDQSARRRSSGVPAASSGRTGRLPIWPSCSASPRSPSTRAPSSSRRTT